MTLDRGDSPLAGRRPAPLSSVTSLGGMNSIGGAVGSVHTPTSASSLGSFSMSMYGAHSGIGSGVSPSESNAVSLSGTHSVGSPISANHPNMNSGGLSSTISSGGGPGSSGTKPGSNPSASAPPSVGGPSGSGSSSNAKPSAATPTASGNSLETASFWLELKGVEQWFDKLEPHERLTLMTSLFQRSPETHLHQYSGSIDQALRHQAATNLSRFGVRHNQPVSNDLSSVYKYRTTLAKPGTSPASKPAQPSSTPLSAGGAGSLSAGSLGPTNLAPPSLSASSLSSTSTLTPPPGSASSSTTSSGKPAGAGAAAAAGAGAGAGAGATSSSNRPAGTGTDGFVSSLAFSSSTGSHHHSSDLYSHAFLPLRRSQGYSPWGTEIRRPNSATADAWSDTSRSSPTFPSGSNTGSPNISTLSLETPPPFPTSAGASNPSSQSPLGHALKPWRTFTPHQNAIGQTRIGSALGQAPDAATSAKSNTTQSSPSSPPSGPVGSKPAPVGSVPGGGHVGSGVPLSASLGSASVSMPSIPLSSHQSSSAFQGGAAVLSHADLSSGKAASAGLENAGSSSSSNSSDSGSSETSSRNTLTSPGAGATITTTGSSTPGNGTPGSGSGTPKDNRLARRSVNVVDVELLSDIGAWLRSLRLHKYTGNLSGMRWQDVVQLSDQDLEDRGVNALGARRKLLKMFEEIRIAQEAGQLPDE